MNAPLPAALVFELNGRPCALAAPPAERLSEALRERLGLWGTKVGCEAGDCGACTVLVDGEPVCACLVALGQVEGRRVTTVEGLAGDPRAMALRKAFAALGAVQCGICTPGMLVAATALLAQKEKPTASEVEDALGGVLCRCTGYRRIVEAVLAVAAGEVPALAPASAGAAVGARAPRLDAEAKASGAERYGADGWPEGSLWLRVVRSPHERARFRLGDLASLPARYPGLAAVFSAADVPNNRFGIFAQTRDQPVFAEGETRFRGEAVLALVGEREAVQRIDEQELPIEWEPLEPVREPAGALLCPPIHPDRADNVLVRGRVARGDVAAALASAAHVVRGAFATAYVEHAYIEPEAGYAEPFVQDGIERVRIYACTQTPYMDREEVAHILGLPADRVQIVPSAVGGGFGGKLDLSVQPLLAVAAWKLKKPVRVVYSREESFAATTKRHPARMRMRMGCDAQGRLVAVDFWGDFNTGAYASWGSTVANRVPIHASGPYAVPAVRARTRAIYTHGPVAGAFRGFGVPQATIAHEALVDELAARTGLDRLEIRYSNALRAGDRTATGQVLRASAGLSACLDALRPRWKEAVAAAERHNRQAGGGRRRGAGIACMWYGIGNTAHPNPSTMRVGLRPEGRIVLYNGAVDIGQGSTTALVQILADALGLPMAAIDSIAANTDRTLDAGKTSASRQTFVSGNAAHRAGRALRARMLRLLEADPEARLRFEGTVLVAEDGGGLKRIDLDELPRDDRGDVLSAEGRFDPPTVPLDENGQGEPYATYAFGAQVAEVDVDLTLGTTRVLRVTAAHDVGRAINPTLVEGQIHGGVAQGIGFALMEEYCPGRTDNLHDYLVPTVGDVPPIEVILIEDTEPLGPFGAKGVGEPAMIATAPAIFGAIRHATGVVVRRAPATPARLRRAIARQGRWTTS